MNIVIELNFNKPVGSVLILYQDYHSLVPYIMDPQNTSEDTGKGLEITKEFLEAIFLKPVKNFRITQGSNQGENYLGILLAVHATLENGVEEHILIKSSPTHPARQGFIKQCGMFHREHFMYNEIFPKVMSSISGKDEKFRLAIAPFLGGNIAGEISNFNDGPWSKETFIVMKDLRHSGYRLSDRIAGLDFDHAKLVVTQLAVIHSLSWVYKQKNGVKFLHEKYPLLIDFAYSSKEAANRNAVLFLPIMTQGYNATKDIVREALGESHPVYQRLSKVLPKDGDELVDILIKYMKKEGIDEEEVEGLLNKKSKGTGEVLKDPWLCCLHGDSWSANFLFKYDPSTGKPIDVKVVDFQLSREACPTLDLAYLLHGSVRTSVRKTCEESLLKIYHETFLQVCHLTSTQPLPGFTFPNLLRRYRRTKIYGLMLAIPCLFIFMMPPEAAENLDELKEKKDLHGLMGGGMEKAERSSGLRNELVQMVTDMWEDGIL